LRIVFVISSLKTGGAQRVATTLTAAWSVRGHTVSIVTFEARGAAPAYQLSESVSLIQLDLLSNSKTIGTALRANWHRIRVLRKCLLRLRPDIVVSFETETNILTLAASFSLCWPIVVSERVHPAHQTIGRPWSTLRRLAYSRASAVVAQTNQIASWLRLMTGAKTWVIPNPVNRTIFGSSPEKKTTVLRRNVLLAVGRLTVQKGFDILVEAFARAAPRIPEWDLKIYGDGPLRSTIEQRIAANGMKARISLHGVIADIASIYRSADAFVHTARYEGYPNVIAEALASGLPVIAIDSPGAVRDLLGGGRYGVLVEGENPDMLAETLVSVLNDREALGSFSRQAPGAVTENDLCHVAETWLSLFHDLISKRCATNV